MSATIDSTQMAADAGHELQSTYIFSPIIITAFAKLNSFPSGHLYITREGLNIISVL